MTAWIKHIDLERFAVTRIPLIEGESTPVSQHAGKFSVGPTGARIGAFEQTDDGWVFRASRQPKTKSVPPLTHGEVIDLHSDLLVFVERPELRNDAIERHLIEAPQDSAAVSVWADWLQEAGDPFGEELAAGRLSDASLEGLASVIADGSLDLVIRDGLIRRAKVRCTPTGTVSQLSIVARLISLRAARLLEDLTVDVFPWSRPTDTKLYGDACAVLRGLSGAAELPNLQRVSFGYVAAESTPTAFFQKLTAKLRTKYAKLNTNEELLPRAYDANLTTLSIPSGVDFLHDGPPQSTRISLASGVWVGASRANSLRALAPGVRREGQSERFLIRQEQPAWCLVPVELDVTLNGRRATPTRLLPGDVIAEPGGATFQFDIDTKPR